MRVLLLARSADPWWTSLKNVLDNPQGIAALQLSSQALTSVGAVHDRALLFRQAVHGFGQALQVNVSGALAMPDSLDDDPIRADPGRAHGRTGEARDLRWQLDRATTGTEQ